MHTAFPVETLYLLALAMLISATGFIRLVYFVSVGYAFSIAGMALLAGILFFPSANPLVWVHLALMTLYGFRLGGFLVAREGSPSYKAELDEVQRRNKKMSIWGRLGIWIGVSVLYVAMFFPAFLRLTDLRAGQADRLPGLTVAGLVVMALGLGLEALADFQKSRAKKKNPKAFARTGLFAWVRYPNYLGEITVWVGSFLAGVSAIHHPLAALPGILGTICIVLIMMGSTKRLEHKQGARYGADPEYQTYVKTVPVLFPFIPLYSIKNIKVYLE